MKGVSHCIIGTSLTVAGLYALNPFPGVDNIVTAGLAFIPAAVGSYLVDIDIKGSKAGRKLQKALSMGKKITIACLVIWALFHFVLHQDNPYIVKAAIISSAVTLVMWVLSRLEHRGPTHSLIVPIAFYVCYTECLTGLTVYTDIIFCGFLSGYVLHIAADMLNGKGCPLLWPIIDSRFHVMDIKYDGFGEKICCVLAVLLAFVIIFLQYII